jgi:hypothetical protein
MQCAQCHVHPEVKSWNQEDFWELNACFQQTEVTESETMDGAGERPLREIVDRPVGGPIYFETLTGVMRVAYPGYAGTRIDAAEGVRRRRELARLMTAGDDPQAARAFVNRTWALLFGAGLTQPVDDMGPHNPPTHPELLDRLSEEFVASGYDVRQLVRWLCSTAAYRRSSRPADGGARDAPETGARPLFSRMYLKPLSAEQVFESLLVATHADRAGVSASEEAAQRRADWLGQFYQALDN